LKPQTQVSKDAECLGCSCWQVWPMNKLRGATLSLADDHTRISSIIEPDPGNTASLLLCGCPAAAARVVVFTRPDAAESPSSRCSRPVPVGTSRSCQSRGTRRLCLVCCRCHCPPPPFLHSNTVVARLPASRWTRASGSAVRPWPWRPRYVCSGITVSFGAHFSKGVRTSLSCLYASRRALALS